MPINTDLNKSRLGTSQSRGELRLTPIQERAGNFARELAQGSSAIQSALSSVKAISDKNAQDYESEIRLEQKVADELKNERIMKKQVELHESKKKREAAAASIQTFELSELDASNKTMQANLGAPELSQLGSKARKHLEMGNMDEAAGSGLGLLQTAGKAAKLRVAEEQAGLTELELSDYDASERFNELMEEELEVRGTSFNEVQALTQAAPEEYQDMLVSLADTSYSLSANMIEKRGAMRKRLTKEAQQAQISNARHAVNTSLVESPDQADALWKMNESIAKDLKAPLSARREAGLEAVRTAVAQIKAGESDMSHEQFEGMIETALKPQGDKNPSPLIDDEDLLRAYAMEVQSHYQTQAKASSADPQAVANYEEMRDTIIKSTKDSGNQLNRVESLKKLLSDAKEGVKEGTTSPALVAHIEEDLLKKIPDALSTHNALMIGRGKYYGILQQARNNSEYVSAVGELAANHGLEDRKDFERLIIETTPKGEKINTDFNQSTEDFTKGVMQLAVNTNKFGIPDEIYNPGKKFGKNFEELDIPSADHMEGLGNNIDVMRTKFPGLYKSTLKHSQKFRDFEAMRSAQEALGYPDNKTVFNKVFSFKSATDEEIGESTEKYRKQSVNEAVSLLTEDTEIDAVDGGLLNDIEAKIDMTPGNQATFRYMANQISRTFGERMTSEQLFKVTMHHMTNKVGYRLAQGKVVFNHPNHSTGVVGDEVNYDLHKERAVENRVHMLVEKRYAGNKAEGIKAEPEAAERMRSKLRQNYTGFVEYPTDDGYTQVYGMRKIDGAPVPLMDEQGNPVMFRSDKTFQMHVKGEKLGDKERPEKVMNKVVNKDFMRNTL